MWFEISIGPGELLDRLTILRLRRNRSGSSKARALAAQDLELLEAIVDDKLGPAHDMDPQIRVAFGALSSLNRRLWDLETATRYARSDESIDVLAREVRTLNDVRSALRASIDDAAGFCNETGKCYDELADGLDLVRSSPNVLLVDMDGVLADTEPMKAEAHVRTVESLGGHLSTDFYRQVLGQSHHDVSVAAMKLSSTSADLEKYSEQFDAHYLQLVHGGVHPISGAKDLLDHARGQGLRVCLVTSSSLKLASEVLTSAGLDICEFNLVVCADDSPRHKPAPDPYLSAMRALWAAPENALAIEDTAPGIQSAASIGIPVIAVSHPLNKEHDLSLARYLVDSPSDKRVLDDISALAGNSG